MKRLTLLGLLASLGGVTALATIFTIMNVETAEAQGGWKSLPTIKVQQLLDTDDPACEAAGLNPPNIATGWCPDPGIAVFELTDMDITQNSVVLLSFDGLAGNIGPGNGRDCEQVDLDASQSTFIIICDGSPDDGATLNYAIINP